MYCEENLDNHSWCYQCQGTAGNDNTYTNRQDYTPVGPNGIGSPCEGQGGNSVNVTGPPFGYSCYGEGIPGCTDSNATNYNDEATIDDGSCLYCPEGQNSCASAGYLNCCIQVPTTNPDFAQYCDYLC